MFFGQFLIQHNIITSEQLEKGLAEQKALKIPLGEVLVHLGFSDKETIDHYLGVHFLLINDELINDPEIRAMV